MGATCTVGRIMNGCYVYSWEDNEWVLCVCTVGMCVNIKEGNTAIRILVFR